MREKFIRQLVFVCIYLFILYAYWDTKKGKKKSWQKEKKGKNGRLRRT
jgi:hypothetical protein